MSAQCDPPNLVQITQRTTTSIEVKWNYFAEVEGFELAIYAFGENPTLEPQTDVITEKIYLFENLEPATSYTVFLRTKCSDNTNSEWNPISTLTTIPNPSPCQINLPIKNNNCNQRYEDFIIEVEGVNGLLGEDVFLESVDLMIEHTWPADLDIHLVSPSGKEIILSEHNGTGTDDYGNIMDDTCIEVSQFSDLACDPISESSPPFIGSFKPEENLRSIEDETSPNGNWVLRTCDRSIPDVGFIKYVSLNFQTLLCPLPQDIGLRNVSGTSADIIWNTFEDCNFLEINVSLAGEEIGSINKYSLNCSLESFTIPDLLPGTSYDVYVLSDCFDTKSPLSCPISLTTLCGDATLVSTFDDSDLCATSCSESCEIQEVWNNIGEDQQDWLVNENETETTGTGPESDVYGSGRYLYIESAPSICGEFNSAILESDCIAIKATEMCSMSFWYHMTGNGIGSLTLLALPEHQTTWDTLFQIHGEQENQWIQQTANLTPYDGKAVKFRFVATLTDQTQGDIAIDEIAFLGSTLLSEGNEYYQDFDLDGYGNGALSETFCALNPPEGFSALDTDCDDENENIHPGMEEIQCNGIDENCNGNEDDVLSSNPILYTSSVISPTCQGVADGMIDLEITGGTPPYTVTWSDGTISEDLRDIPAGIFYADIKDSGGCITRTSFFDVTAVSSINIFVTENVRPTCNGIEDGRVTVQSSGGQAPYKYDWNTGDTTATVENIGKNSIWVTVTDVMGCTATSDTIVINPLPKINVGVVLQKNIRCHGDENGQIILDAFGGAPPFTYTWKDGHEGNEISDLAAGTYTCKVVDQNGCENDISVTLTQPEPLTLILSSKENNLCNGDQKGIIKTYTKGGTKPYTYRWNSGEINDDIFNLPAGLYEVIVTDANVCKDTISQIPILHPFKLEASIVENTASTCRRSGDGTLIIKTEGGVEDYSYFWSHNTTDTDTLLNLNSGIYSVTIIDDNECKTNIDNIEVGNANLPLDVSVSKNDINVCGRDSLSSIYAEVASGALPIDYNWSSGVQNVKSILKDTIFNLPGGKYVVTATDIKGCVGISDTVNLVKIPPISANASIINNLCYGDQNGEILLNPTGGQSPYKYQWDTGNTNKNLSDLGNGPYSVTITDRNECEYVTPPFNITSPAEILIDTLVTASGGSDEGKIKLSISGGKKPYNINWPENVDLISDTEAHRLSSGYYDIVVTDQNNCIQEISVYVPIVTSSIDIKLENDIIVYPNPTTQGTVNILNQSSHQIKKVELVSASGKRITDHLSNFEKIHIDRPGLYFLKILIDEQVVIKKLVVLE